MLIMKSEEIQKFVILKCVKKGDVKVAGKVLEGSVENLILIFHRKLELHHRTHHIFLK